MKAWRIKNDIVAAVDEQEAIAAWAEHRNMPHNSAGAVEEVPTDITISLEQEDGSFAEGTLAEAMPPDGWPAQVVCEGECECCG